MLKKDEHESHGFHEYIIFTRAIETLRIFIRVIREIL